MLCSSSERYQLLTMLAESAETMLEDHRMLRRHACDHVTLLVFLY
jgi:predicted RNA-binding Zn ribbon-like protein